MRPIPLSDADRGLLHGRLSGPLDTVATAERDYLGKHVSGETLVVGGCEDRTQEYADVVSQVTGRKPTVRVSSATTADAVKANEWFPDESPTYDSIIYTKSKMAWFARPTEFHRLSELLATGGTLLSSAKWVPDSDRLQMEQIDLLDPLGFEPPQSYLRFSRVQSTFEDSWTPQSGETRGDGGVVMQQQQGRGTGPPRRLPRPFDTDEEQRGFREGWAWHEQLRETVKQLVADAGTVANICCGSNRLGDIRIDLTKEYTNRGGTGQTAATHLGDGRNLPLQDGAVDAVITDPPWKIPYEERVALFSEAVRVARETVIVNAWWIPVHPFVTLNRIIPTTANVSETDLGGPGGLSFLSVYDVDGQQSKHNYSLSDHFEIGGRKAMSEIVTDCLQQHNHPNIDPRIRTTPSAFACQHCGTAPNGSTRIVGNETIHHCPECGFPNRFEDLKPA
ncbi:hypothetical protein SAMN05216388_102524 [Halorientalis persicus]|uniref:Uncharacterized protein n=1 Tax=Halorientalis persicus TaxID=1367881 RepID=A0A1H8U308_9EURY|nr:hypothetical protein [Halorientalis persicus]SEO97223.1 hypothetical protein SAMN05216388_102524 [Halorientalis persicus]